MMSNTVFITVVLAVLATNLGTVLAIVWYFGGRIDKLTDEVHALRLDLTVHMTDREAPNHPGPHRKYHRRSFRLLQEWERE